MSPFRYFRLHFGLYLLLFWGVVGGCRREPGPAPSAGAAGDVYLELEPTVAGAPLLLNSASYPNGNGEQFTVSTFKYYLSNVKLRRRDGSVYAVPNSYYLVDAGAPASQHVAVPRVPAGEYTGLSFTVGVDSARNVAGAQTGALDPVNGMFWDWNSGYVFLRLEGTSAASATGRLLFNVMGFQRPYNALRTIAPSFQGATLVVGPDHQPEVHLAVDVQKLFAGPAPIRFADVYDSEGGPSAVKVADNYAAGMFTLEHIHPN